MGPAFKVLLLSATICAGSPLLSQSPPAATGTVQQQFEAASNALDAGQWEQALGIFAALEAKLKPSTSLGLVQLRKAEALMALGRSDEARAALTLGLAHVDDGNASHREDLSRAHYTLGSISESALDYAGALVHYRTAERLAPLDSWRVQAIASQVRTETFFDAVAAAANADRALALAATMQIDKGTVGALENLKGRALLNAGRFKEAQAVLLAAVRKHGGLTMKVDVSDVASRSDLAIAALLGGDEDEGRRYMAYTGAGRLPEAFMGGADMAAPSCTETGLSPDDVAVVQFAVGDDGTVSSAIPVYASRQGESALEFARAVSRWSWTPENVAKVPLLFRAMTRMEMRCSTADNRPSILSMLGDEFDKWVDTRALGPVADNRADAASVEPLRAELARREAEHGASDPRLLPVLLALSRNALVPTEETAKLLGRALPIARSAQAPAPVITYLSVWQAQAGSRTNRKWKAPDLTRTLADPVIAGDPRSRAAVLLIQADQLSGDKQKEAARAMLEQVKAIEGLDRLDPLRIGALIRIAALDAASGEIEAARAAYLETGLSEQQCALVDARPVRTGGSASFNDFPDDALRWGFEGWAVTEFDVTASGDSVNTRTTLAYPPFIFGPAGRKIIDRFRYSQSFRPEGSLGCGGLRQPVSFRLP